MSASLIGLTVTGAAEAATRMTRAAQGAKATQERGLNAAAARVLAALKHRMSDAGGHNPFFGRTGGRGDTLAARSGGSRARLVLTRAHQAGGVMTAGAGSPDKHVRFLENGGTITGGKLLRIPLAAAQTPQGVDRWAGQSARSIPGAFLIRSHGGRLFIVREQGGKAGGGGRSRMEFLYQLVKQVRVRGRHVFAGAEHDADAEVRALAGQQVVTQIVRVANGGA
jgi:hypothetical protein